MTNDILNSNFIQPLSKKEPKQIVVLCHGYGGDGKDISTLAINWQRFLPEAIFICPNAPEVCAINPMGFQWFDLESDKDEIIFEKTLKAEKILNTFLDQMLNNYNLKPEKMAMVGFSQGTMIGLQTVLKKKTQINCFVGYSGKIINQKHLSENINSKPKIFLMHGDIDTIVSPTHLLEAKDYLKKYGIKAKTKLFKNCEHKIPVEGTSLGLGFLQKNLL